MRGINLFLEKSAEKEFAEMRGIQMPPFRVFCVVPCCSGGLACATSKRKIAGSRKAGASVTEKWPPGQRFFGNYGLVLFGILMSGMPG